MKVKTLLGGLAQLKSLGFPMVKPPIPIIENVMLDGGKLSATDLDTFVSIQLDEKFDGKVLLPVLMLHKVLALMDPDTDLQLELISTPDWRSTEAHPKPDIQQLQILQGHRQFKLAVEPTADFPILTKPPYLYEAEWRRFTSIDLGNIARCVRFTDDKGFNKVTEHVLVNGTHVAGVSGDYICQIAHNPDSELTGYKKPDPLVNNTTDGEIFGKAAAEKLPSIFPNGCNIFIDRNGERLWAENDGIEFSTKYEMSRFPGYQVIFKNVSKPFLPLMQVSGPKLLEVLTAMYKTNKKGQLDVVLGEEYLEISYPEGAKRTKKVPVMYPEGSLAYETEDRSPLTIFRLLPERLITCLEVLPQRTGTIDIQASAWGPEHHYLLVEQENTVVLTSVLTRIK